jgi:thioredoxin 1
MFGPIMEEVSKEIPVQKVNVDDENDLAMQYGVRSVPTIVLVNESGKELSRHVGVQQKSMVLENYKSFSK